ncbi:MAG: hypothetical protein AAF705_17440 [Bacteroidota bacterium]
MQDGDHYFRRINAIRSGPFSWKEKDILTGAEIYLAHVVNFSLIKMVGAYFTTLSQSDQQQIDLIWDYQMAAYHLKQTDENLSGHGVVQELRLKASTIYSLEAQRLLGGLFPLADDFWKTFYRRQEIELDKALIAIDALHFAASKPHPILYELLIQSFREILKGRYAGGEDQQVHFQTAIRLLGDLPLIQLKNWLRRQSELNTKN